MNDKEKDIFEVCYRKIGQNEFKTIQFRVSTKDLSTGNLTVLLPQVVSFFFFYVIALLLFIDVSYQYWDNYGYIYKLNGDLKWRSPTPEKS